MDLSTISYFIFLEPEIVECINSIIGNKLFIPPRVLILLELLIK